MTLSRFSLAVALFSLIGIGGCSQQSAEAPALPISPEGQMIAAPEVLGTPGDLELSLPVEMTDAELAGDASSVAPSSETAEPTLAFYTVDHYDESRDPAQDLEMTIQRAKKENKRILVQVGGEWCGWCKLMTDFIDTNEKVREMVSDNYLLMKVTWTSKQKNEAFLSAYPKISGYPHLYVLDTDGTLLHSQETGDLEEGKGYNEATYLAFLEKWAM